MVRSMAKPLINISSKNAYIFSAFLVFYEFLTYIANDMIMPGMIQVVKSFNAPQSAIASSLTAYILGGASLQLILGPISDRYGRRPVMLTGVCLFFLCTVSIVFSNSMDQFTYARFFQGMGLCFIGVIGYATLQEIFAENDAVKLIAIMANVSILAPLAGPLLGSVFIHFFSWRYIFVCIAILSLIALWGLWRWMPESIGAIKTNGDTIKITSLSLKDIFRNYKQLLCNKVFLCGSLAVSVLTIPCMCWIALSPLILITNAKLTSIEYALWQLPVFGASIFGNWLLHYLTSYYALKTIVKAGSIISVISLLILYLLPLLFNSTYLFFMPGLILYFFSLGISTAPLQRIILFATPVAKGTSSALMAMITMCNMAIGIELGNAGYFLYGNRVLAIGGITIALLFSLFITLMLQSTNKNRSAIAKHISHKN